MVSSKIAGSSSFSWRVWQV